jgi:protein-disulfide isomerase
MKNEKKSSALNIISSPVFFLVVIIIIFAGIFYFSNRGQNGGPVSFYIEDETIKNGANIKGDVNTPITIVEYGDYECPACGNSYNMVESVLKEYDGKVKLEYRHYPLPFHKFAEKASIASECAGEQKKFWEMHEKLYKNQKNLKESDLEKYAKEIVTDFEKFKTCFDANGYLNKINKQKGMGEKDNISGTPSFFIEGRVIENANDKRYLPVIDDFRREIDIELGKNK